MSNYRQFFEHLTSEHPFRSTNRKDTYGYIWETQVCIWFLKNDPIWKTKFKPETIMSPQDWGYGIISSTTGKVITQDIGIDIVAEDHDGKLWGIQTKCYTNQIPTTEIQSFITALGLTWISVTDPGRTKEMDKGLLLATDEISRTMRSKMLGNKKEVVTVGPGYFDTPESELDWFESINKAPKSTYTLKTPMKHQAEALENIENGWQDNNRGKCIMACGTGKTLVGLWTSEALQSKTTLVLLPSLSLVNQIATEWVKEAKIPISPLFVCSDKTVKKGADVYITNTEDLGFPVTTDENEIVSFFQNAPAEHRVVFSTYQSSESIENAQNLGAPKFDIVIADEAHHCAGKVDGDFARVLDESKIRSDKRLFMTATPKINKTSPRINSDSESLERASMDDEGKFGPYFHTLTFGEAIRRELLSDYQVVINVTTEQDGEKWVDEFQDLPLIASFIEGIEKHNLSHIIAFHDRIKKSKKFVEDFKQVFSRVHENYENNLPFINHIDGKMSTKERTGILKQFRETDGGINIISNCNCLTEGVDVRAIDGIAFFAPKQSQIDIVQAVGRAIRKNKEGKPGTIFLQFLISQKGINDPESSIQKSDFQGVWSVLQALRDHDAVLGNQLDSLAFEWGKTKNMGELPDRINVDLPPGLDASFFSQFKTFLVMETAARWQSNLGAFVAYKKENPDWHIPSKATYGDFKIGQWAGYQRQEYHKGKLPLERIQQLEEAGMSFNYGIGPDTSKFHTAEETHDYNLVSWVNYQRDLYNKDTMTLERIQRLEETGMILDIVSEEDKKTHDYNLLSWGDYQREAYNKGTMTLERIQRLEEAGMIWDIVSEEAWEVGYQALVAYRKQYPYDMFFEKANPKYRDYNLGTWVEYQKTDYFIFTNDDEYAKYELKKMKFMSDDRTPMTAERLQRLEEVGIWFVKSSEELGQLKNLHYWWMQDQKRTGRTDAERQFFKEKLQQLEEELHEGKGKFQRLKEMFGMH